LLKGPGSVRLQIVFVNDYLGNSPFGVTACLNDLAWPGIIQNVASCGVVELNFGEPLTGYCLLPRLQDLRHNMLLNILSAGFWHFILMLARILQHSNIGSKRKNF